MGDHTAAMTGAAMIGAALFSRQRTGRGQLVSTSLLRQGAYTIGFDVNIALLWGRSVSVGTRETMGNPTVNNYATGDGKELWIVGLEGDRHWPALARAIDRPEWLDDPRFATGRDRAINARELVSELDAVFATRTRDEWAEAFEAEPDVFWAPVNSVDDLLEDQQFHASGALVEVPDEHGSRIMLATPADFDRMTPSPRWRAPEQGEDTESVMLDLERDPTAWPARKVNGEQ
jgi:crotonobetainyl-CoA:carnitine CoA-transferase CaiB-like acyl-CoA transferase